MKHYTCNMQNCWFQTPAAILLILNCWFLAAAVMILNAKVAEIK